MKIRIAVAMIAAAMIVSGCRNIVVMPLPPAAGSEENLDKPGKNLGFEGGNGTEANPYEVSGEEQLRKLSELVNGGNDFAGEYLILSGGEIDLSASASFRSARNAASNWDGIGSEEVPFKGILDGDHTVIKGLVMTGEETGDNGHGLFNVLGDGAVVRNLTVGGRIEYAGSIDASGSPFDNGIGLIAGISNGNVTIENCSTLSGSTVKGSTAGGIIGRSNGNITMTEVTNNADVSANDDVNDKAAGIVAAVFGEDSTLTAAENYGDINSLRYSGGIVGLAHGTDIINARNEGDITGASSIGGIIGNPRGKSVISGAVNMGDISIAGNEGEASTAIAGIAGNVQGDLLEITGAENYGEIALDPAFDGTAVNNIGGIVGNAYSAVSIYGSVNSGKIALESAGVAVTSVGGVAGSLSAGAAIGDDPEGKATSNGVDIAAGSQTGGIVGSLSYGSVKAENSGNISGTARVGGIVGYTDAALPTTVSDSTNSGDVVGSSENAGGIIGYANAGNPEDSLIVSGCISAAGAEISTEARYAGGIVGRQIGNVMVVESFNYSSVSASEVAGYSHAGGITGSATNSGFESTEDFTIGVIDSENHGDVTGTGYNVCGIGYIGADVTFSGCRNYGAITGDTAYGIANTNAGKLSDCENHGTVTQL